MNKALYNDALEIINYSIKQVQPAIAVKKALKDFKRPKGKTIMVAIGKAAYAMAKETIETIDIDEGLVVTKYGHSKGKLKNTTIIESGHPIPDENSIKGANAAIEMCSKLTKEDTVIFLISGGGSALFEAPLVSLKELQDINIQLIKCGANINEINSIRKKLSKVKGGKLVKICSPAKIINIILSDVINDQLDMIASGPTCPDSSTTDTALNTILKYNLNFDDKIINLLHCETIKKLDNVETFITGNNEELKIAAKNKAKELGYKPIYIREALIDDIKESTKYLKSLIEEHINDNENTAIIAGGEIVVEVKGSGLGGRNQELACRLSPYLQEKNACVFAIGSDGTDGPTDAAGGYADKDTYSQELNSYLNNNDSYHYLEKNNGLIKTGPTGTNVCDLYCILIKSNHNI